MTFIQVVFGRDKQGLEVSDIQGTLTEALIEREKERKRWWKPWVRYEIEGYEEPYND